MDNIDNRLEEMSTELSNYKDAVNYLSEYKRVYYIARTMPIITHPLVKEKS